MPILNREMPSTPNATPAQLPRIVTRSNLSLLGTFLHILRERFSTDATTAFPWTWVEEPAETGVVIELAYSEEAERRGQLPAIYVGKAPTSWQPVIVGDRAGTNLPRAEETKMMHGSTTIIANVVTRNAGECFVLGDIVSHAFLNASDFLRSGYNLRDVFNVVEGTITPYPKEKTWWQLPVSVTLEFTERWAQQEEQVTLESIKTYLPTGNVAPAYYTQLALTSLG